MTGGSLFVDYTEMNSDHVLLINDFLLNAGFKIGISRNKELASISSIASTFVTSGKKNAFGRTLDMAK